MTTAAGGGFPSPPPPSPKGGGGKNLVRFHVGYIDHGRSALSGKRGREESRPVSRWLPSATVAQPSPARGEGGRMSSSFALATSATVAGRSPARGEANRKLLPLPLPLSCLRQ